MDAWKVGCTIRDQTITDPASREEVRNVARTMSDIESAGCWCERALAGGGRVDSGVRVIALLPRMP